ncbi:MAG: hypothetical protein K0Q92_1216 [Steroidobacteraceae bacterium]|jgi:hypothetical protein|nr:hypothetical protein [Steroidobacteraceae bacterium]
MNEKLTLRGTLTSLPIHFGVASIGFSLAQLLVSLFRARGDGVGIDAVAASTTLAIKGIVVGIIILAIGVVARVVLKPRARNAP